MSRSKKATIILLHGFPASRSYWNGKTTFLKRAGYKTVAIDILGFGNAPKPRTSAYSYNDHVKHITNELERLKIEYPVILIGHSMGALLAARFANLHPDSVSRIILLNPPLYKTAEEARETIQSTSRLYSFLLSSRFRQPVWGLLRPLSLFIIGKHTQLSREQTLKNIVFGGKAFEDLNNLKNPALLLVGKNDRPQYVQNLTTEKISEQVEVRIENITHHSLLFQKRLVQTLILEFLKK